MVVFAMMNVAVLGIVSLFKMLGKQQMRSNMAAQSDMMRRNLLTIIQNDEAWQNTVNDTANTSLACLKNHTTCTGAGGPFRVMNSQNVLVYDALSSPSTGMTVDGQTCSTFDATNGNDQCPLRLDLSWTAVCSGTCMVPQVQITGTATFKPRSKEREIAYNASNYSFKLIRNTTSGPADYFRAQTSIHNYGFVPGVAVKFPYDTVTNGNAANFNAGTSTYTVPEAGVYMVSASVCWITNSQHPDAWCRSELIAAGISISNGLGRYVSNACENTLAAPVALNAGDQIWVQSGATNPDSGSGTPNQSTCPQTDWSVLSVVKMR